MKKRSIGIIGGMGPDASARLYQTMIDLARSEYGAKENQHYPDIILHSVPVPDFISDRKKIPDALAMLSQSARTLGPVCQVLGIACNTAHLLLNDLRSQTATPFVSMIELTAKQALDDGYRRIGLLATPTTIRSGLYQNALGRHGIEVVLPANNQIDQLGKIVQTILAGKYNGTADHLTTIADSLVDRGAETIILGCTELPLVFPKKYVVPIISSLDVLAEALLSNLYQREGKNEF